MKRADTREKGCQRSAREHRNAESAWVLDLGAASQATRGVWDPVMKENHIMPEARDS